MKTFRCRTNHIVVASVALLMMLETYVHAAITTYTNRALWSAALSGAPTVENFNSLPLGTNVTSATVFPSGIQVQPTGSDITDISDFAFSSIGQGNALRTFNNLTISFPSSVVAFGFDYADLDLAGAQVVVGSFSHVLALTGDADTGVTPDDFAFFGLTATPADIPGSAFQFQLLGFEGTDLDNLGFLGVPEPSSVLVVCSGLALFAGRRRCRRGK